MCSIFSLYERERERKRDSKRIIFSSIVTTYGEKDVLVGEWLSYCVLYLSILLKISISILSYLFNNSKGYLIGKR